MEIILIIAWLITFYTMYTMYRRVTKKRDKYQKDWMFARDLYFKSMKYGSIRVYHNEEEHTKFKKEFIEWMHKKEGGYKLSPEDKESIDKILKQDLVIPE